MNRQNGLVTLVLSISLLPGIIGATPLVSMKSNKVVLTAEASGTMISGGEWRLTRRLQTDFFEDGHVSIYGEQVNLDVDGNLVIDQNEDEVIDLCIIASFERSGTAFGTSTHATLYDEGTLSGINAGPLADLRDGSLNIQAKVWFKSIFKVTGETPVEFGTNIVNYESNNNNSFGRTAIWDLDTGDLVLNLDDRLFAGYHGHAKTLLLPNHTYKLLSVTNNQTGGDDDIGGGGSFHDAMITVAEPPGFAIFSLGLIFLAASNRERLRGSGADAGSSIPATSSLRLG